MAAISGHIDTLKHLDSVGFDLWLHAYQGPNVPSSPLVAALERGHESVVEYLCGNGSIQRLTDDQVFHACRAAASNGHVHVLRRIENCYPKETDDWWYNHAGVGGGLYPNRIDWYIFGPEKPLKESERAAMLQHFILKELYDIHATDRDGNNVLHLAAAEGSLDLFRQIWNSGADGYRPNNAGQSPIESAVNGESGIANWLSKEQRVKIPITRNEKIKPARMIIEAQRQLRIQEIIVRLLHNYGKKDIPDKEGLKVILEIINKQWAIEKMDEKLADIWVHHYSFTAMNAYIDKASKVLEAISSSETLFNILFRNLEDIPRVKIEGDRGHLVRSRSMVALLEAKRRLKVADGNRARLINGYTADAYIDDLTTVVTMSLPRKITATQWFDLTSTEIGCHSFFTKKMDSEGTPAKVGLDLLDRTRQALSLRINVAMPMTQSAYAHPTSLRALIKPEEDWTKISDFGKRRRMQNRLAQRKYRNKVKRLAGSSDDVEADKPRQKPTKCKRRSSASRSRKPRSTGPRIPGVSQHQFNSPVKPTGEPGFPDTYDDQISSNEQFRLGCPVNPASIEIPLPLYDFTQPDIDIVTAGEYAASTMSSTVPMPPSLATHFSDSINSETYPSSDGFNPYMAYSNMTPMELNYLSLYDQLYLHVSHASKTLHEAARAPRC
ncbi:uncharacterized protein BKA55DRAFT_595251 [Fusarium redolens]|uniref:BZIP domain-containing protein n=1 Tax=Fusarium redolens TaxID=48865 RepID=A0A9P9GY67_FUSRE|nr:uncharacterized protein BKA55DRAFT_595251 [Fusarium redolens]KAH7247699.1 hypothetical protein BKA55DRAFT_595251 [Fusarium redolens]